ncbi:peptide deformylase [Rugosimonospora africana]|uniref:Peptide deformylase n=1 Tax=Rugosimonospora africana TaxID=556532 RepID=A0A8J3R1L6_9ACTN|nr:peptide deformylase [Rugosimonospora africana]GIH20551.1 peptide deformylase [Rugosimonospora africana]
MTAVSIRLVGDPVLRRPASPVEVYDAELRKLVRDLRDTLQKAGGAGLAAPQIGVGLRVFVISPALGAGKVDHVVNPMLSFPDETEQDGPEGCLSLPGIYLDTKRRMNVVATGHTVKGDPVQIVGEGLLARCIQHETDHLDGVLFTDRRDVERQRRLVAAVRDAVWSDNRDVVVKTSPH